MLLEDALKAAAEGKRVVVLGSRYQLLCELAQSMAVRTVGVVSRFSRPELRIDTVAGGAIFFRRRSDDSALRGLQHDAVVCV